MTIETKVTAAKAALAAILACEDLPPIHGAEMLNGAARDFMVVTSCARIIEDTVAREQGHNRELALRALAALYDCMREHVVEMCQRGKLQ